jgi:chromosome segregation ATPase
LPKEGKTVANEIWIAAIGALGGTGVLKIIEHVLNRGKIKDDTATQFRRELREEVAGLKTELNRVESDLDIWKQKYYDLLGQFVQVKSELEGALNQIRSYATQNARIATDASKNLARNNELNERPPDPPYDPNTD